jgi:acetyl esterase
MPLDPVAKVILEFIQAGEAKPLSEMTVSEARASYEATRELNPHKGAEVATVAPLEVGGVPCVLVTPLEIATNGIIVFLHGGGWVLGTPELYTPAARDLAAAATLPVLLVDYALAPEHPFPTGLHDVLAVIDALLRGDTPLDVDPAKVIIAGDSAGGNLAAVAAVERPQLALQVLIYPVTDATMSHDSHTTMGEDYALTTSQMAWFFDHYITDAQRLDPRVSPLHYGDEQLRTAPPAFVAIAVYDPLADEGLAYAAKLAAAGVDVATSVYDGQMHGFFQLAAFLEDAVQLLREVGEAARLAALRSTPSS